MYFKNFPTIIYDSVGDLQYKDVKNLLRRVGLRTKVRTNSLFYDTYNVKEGETPEIIASKLYGDPQLHWVIMLINDRYDYVNDFPLENDALEAMITANYTSPDAVKWYKKDGLVVDSTVAGAVAQTHRQYEQDRNEAKRRIKIVTPTLVNQIVREFKKMEI